MSIIAQNYPDIVPVSEKLPNWLLVLDPGLFFFPGDISELIFKVKYKMNTT